MIYPLANINNNLHYCNNNVNNFIPNNYNLYNNFNNNLMNNNDNFALNIDNPKINNHYGISNDHQQYYNPNNFTESNPINNINWNLINGNIKKNLLENQQCNAIPQNQNNLQNINNIGYIHTLNTIGAYENQYNQLNHIDTFKNNEIISNFPNTYNDLNDINSRKQKIKLRPISCNYRANLSLLNDTRKNDVISYESIVKNIHNTNNYSNKRCDSSTGRILNEVYKPYNLEDYRKIANVKVELGSLGPNIGTKEWEEKQEKMKKMEEYANKIKNNKIILKTKKETPIELIEKEKILKKEISSRNKAYKYDSLVRGKIIKAISSNHINNEFTNGNLENIDVSEIIKNKEVNKILNKYNKENRELKYNYKEFNATKILDGNQANDSKSQSRIRSSGRIRNVKIQIHEKELNHNNQNLYQEKSINKVGFNDIQIHDSNNNNNEKQFSNNNYKNDDYLEKRKILNQIDDEFDLEYNYSSKIDNLNFIEKEINRENEIEKIQKKRLALASKINEIKESFL